MTKSCIFAYYLLTMKRRTIFNLLLFALILSFFVTPLGYESKILLQRIFAKSATILPKNEQYTIDEDWVLKDRNNVQFNFKQSQKKVKFVYFWSSWQAMSVADLSGIQKLYNDYHQKVDFYIITNELPELPEKLQRDRKYNFKITYLIIDEKMPFNAEKIPSGYIIDKQARVVAQSEGNTRWNSNEIRKLLDILLTK